MHPVWDEVGEPSYLVLLRVGFTELPMSPPRLVRSYRTVSPLPDSAGQRLRRSTRASGGLFSVALSLGSPPLDVIQHPALWSPDFPPFAAAKSDHLTSFALLLSCEFMGHSKKSLEQAIDSRQAKVTSADSADRSREFPGVGLLRPVVGAR